WMKFRSQARSISYGTAWKNRKRFRVSWNHKRGRRVPAAFFCADLNWTKERSSILRRVRVELVMALALLTGVAAAQTVASSAAQPAKGTLAKTNPVQQDDRPWHIGLLTQGGFGVTESRGNFHFFMAGVRAGKVLTPIAGHGLLCGNFELGAEVFPFWQSYTPYSYRQNCVTVTSPFGIPQASCSTQFRIGGTST